MSWRGATLRIDDADNRHLPRLVLAPIAAPRAADRGAAAGGGVRILADRAARARARGVCGRLVTVAAESERTGEPRVRDAFFIVEPNRDQLAGIAGLIDANALRPVVDSVFPLSNAKLAYERRTVRGKAVLDMTV